MLIYHFLVSVFAIIISPIMFVTIKRYSEEQEVLSKDFFKDSKFDWKVALITLVILNVLFYKFGISLQFMLYAILTIILIMEAFIDIKAQILPNSLNFIGFLIGIVYTYFVCLDNVMAGIDLLFGMIVGAGIFLLIAAFALIVYKKEGMGLGDVKLMGMLGLYFGLVNIIQIFIISFFIAAIISLILILLKIKKTTDYIAFGPFIVIAAVFTMLVPASTLMPYINTLLKIG